MHINKIIDIRDGTDRPADKSTGYVYKARLRGLRLVLVVSIILLMFIRCWAVSGNHYQI